MARAGWGKLIADGRAAMGWSQKELAGRLLVSRPTVTRWESEEVEPDKAGLVRLVNALPISGDVLMEKLGYPISPSPAARLPREILDLLAELDLQELHSLVKLLAPRSSETRAKAGPTK